MILHTQNGATIEIQNEDIVFASWDTNGGITKIIAIPFTAHFVTKANYKYDVSYDGAKWYLLEVTDDLGRAI